jgi:hypothetical protein
VPLESFDPDLVHFGISRAAEALPCKCGGYADKVASTEAECREFGCGRDVPGAECCAAAFSCRLCGGRIRGKREAPEFR